MTDREQQGRAEGLLREGTEVLRTGGGTTLTASQCRALVELLDAERARVTVALRVAEYQLARVKQLQEAILTYADPLTAQQIALAATEGAEDG